MGGTWICLFSEGCGFSILFKVHHNHEVYMDGLKSILEIVVSETPETSRGKDVTRLANQFLSISKEMTDTLYQELSTAISIYGFRIKKYSGVEHVHGHKTEGRKLAASYLLNPAPMAHCSDDL